MSIKWPFNKKSPSNSVEGDLAEAVEIVEGHNQQYKREIAFCNRHNISLSPYPSMAIKEWIANQVIEATKQELR